MPPDTSQSKRSARKPSHEDDLENRRSRGEISCAECRRLKLKCDKRIPCSTCVRRGCPSICPNGCLSSGHGTRFVLADTSELHTKIAEMGKRIRELEDALAISHSGTSNEPHPLLRDELLYIKYGPETNITAPKERRRDPPSEMLDALGTLTVGGPEEAKYFGRSAGPEMMLLTGADMEEAPDIDEISTTLKVDAEILHLSKIFPVNFDDKQSRILKVLYGYLPEQPRAWSLCEAYLEHTSWQFAPIRREELINDVLVPVYRGLKEGQAHETIASPHRLAVLFMVLAQGALVDLTLEQNSTEAEDYFHLSRAALSLRSVFDSPEVATVQAVVLVASYYSMAGKRYTMDSTWNMISLGCKLAQGLGLHRDSARWHLDAKTVQRRRQLFWELHSCEVVYSISIGRPSAIRMSYVDCEFPADEEGLMDKDGNPLIGFYQLKYEFCRDITLQLTELTLSATPPGYDTILDLDRQVREKILPPHLNTFMDISDPRFTPSTYMRGCLLGQYKSVVLLYIHRTYFTQAILDDPVNPLRSRYAPSFLAAYRCASGIIQACLNHYERLPELCTRWWSTWTHLFSAALVVGITVARSPASVITPHAFVDLGLACELFEKGAPDTRRARVASRILRRLRDKAYEVYSQHKSDGSLPTTSSIGHDDELAHFDGRTKVVFSKLMATKFGRPSPRPMAPSSSAIQEDNTILTDAHPSLVEYLSSLPSPEYSQGLLPNSSHYHGQLLYQNDAMHTSPGLPARQSYEDQPAVDVGGSQYLTSTDTGSMANDLGASPEGFADLEVMLSMGSTGIDAQWNSFMRDLGILDASQGY